MHTEDLVKTLRGKVDRMLTVSDKKRKKVSRLGKAVKLGIL